MRRCEVETLCDSGICPYSVFSEAVPGGSIDPGDGRALQVGTRLGPTSSILPPARPWCPQWTCRVCLPSASP